MKTIPTQMYQFHSYYANLPLADRKKPSNLSWEEIRTIIQCEHERVDLNIHRSVFIELCKLTEKLNVGDNDELITELIKRAEPKMTVDKSAVQDVRDLFQKDIAKAKDEVKRKVISILEEYENDGDHGVFFGEAINKVQKL